MMQILIFDERVMKSVILPDNGAFVPNWNLRLRLTHHRVFVRMAPGVAALIWRPLCLLRGLLGPPVLLFHNFVEY